MIRTSLLSLTLVFIFLFSACNTFTPTSSPTKVKPAIPTTKSGSTLPTRITPQKTAHTPTPRVLTICQAAEPTSLYIYNSNSQAGKNILEAIYDGPIDYTSYSYQPVILKKLPSLVDGDAVIQPVVVQENDLIVNIAGEVVPLKSGENVRPYGRNLASCTITWQGEALEMAQMAATFTLKEGIRWSDGTNLTAYDSAFGFENARRCNDTSNNIDCGFLGAGGQQTVDRTASYTALDENTTQWVGVPGFFDQNYMTNFAHPLQKSRLQGLSPEELFVSEQSTLNPMGWGSYLIDKWQPGEYIRLKKNIYYYRADEGLPHFDILFIRFLGGTATDTLSTLQDGDCDLIDSEQATKYTTLELVIEGDHNGQIQALITPDNIWDHLDFNIRPNESIINSGAFAGWDLDGDGMGPFGDTRLRQAIAKCLDRQSVVQAIYSGQSNSPDTYLPANHPLFNPQVEPISFDPQTAAAFLDDIGWLNTDNDPSSPRLAKGVTGVPDGTALEMNYEIIDTNVRQQVFDILSGNLEACGIKVNLRTYSADEFLKKDVTGRVYGRLYDLAEFAQVSESIPPCKLYLSDRLPGENNGWSGENNVGFTNSAYDKACSQQLTSLPGEMTYAQAVLEAQRIVSEQLPSIPLFLRILYAAARVDMCGFSVDPTSQSDFWNIETFDYGEGCK